MMMQKEFFDLIRTTRFMIGYSAMSDEPNVFEQDFLKTSNAIVEMISSDKNQDPFVVAQSFIEKIGNRSVCIFIPGQQFDGYGGRKGRGGGWYDKFLSSVPQDWIRIGVCRDANFSQQEISQNSWDQKMDWVLVFNEMNSYVPWKIQPSR